MKTYSWAAPKYFEGDYVMFNAHHWGVQVGKILIIQTRYPNEKSSHNYSILPNGWSKSVWVGEGNIISKPSPIEEAEQKTN